jgi:hypothetical protein
VLQPGGRAQKEYNMRVDTIKMDPRIAKVHYSDYMEKCRKHREKRKKELEQKRLEGSKQYRSARVEISDLEREDFAMLGAYRALRRGQMILNLNHVLANGGLNEDCRPNLAVARANHKFCNLRSRGWGDIVEFISTESERIPGNPKTKDIIKYPFFDGFHSMTNVAWRKRNNHPVLRARSLVPTVPAHLRPDDLDSGKYHILWEASPPDDPLLLKQIDKSDFYVVLAQWDLTPLEQQVMAGRFSPD